MAGNQHRSDQKASQKTRERLRKSERGDQESAHEVNEMDEANDSAAISVEQEASEGPEGRGLPR